MRERYENARNYTNHHIRIYRPEDVTKGRNTSRYVLRSEERINPVTDKKYTHYPVPKVFIPEGVEKSVFKPQGKSMTLLCNGAPMQANSCYTSTLDEFNTPGEILYPDTIFIVSSLYANEACQKAYAGISVPYLHRMYVPMYPVYRNEYDKKPYGCLNLAMAAPFAYPSCYVQALSKNPSYITFDADITSLNLAVGYWNNNRAFLTEAENLYLNELIRYVQNNI